jgi:hypothetical protein
LRLPGALLFSSHPRCGRLFVSEFSPFTASMSIHATRANDELHNRHTHPLAAPSPRVRGEGRDEGASPLA